MTIEIIDVTKESLLELLADDSVYVIKRIGSDHFMRQIRKCADVDKILSEQYKVLRIKD